MRIKKYRQFVGDFETTVYENQEYTEVWASALVELYSEDVKILHSIDDTFNYLVNLEENVIVYYHNLKFDGAFWLSYLIRDRGMKQALEDKAFKKDKYMSNNSFKYMISNKGQWYTIIIKVNNHFIEIRDSLKLIPFSVATIGKSFGTKHKKLDMEYKGFRYAGCEITQEEKRYIANDVLVVKEALEIMFNDGHNKLTIGSCCLAEYKKIIGKYQWKEWFPDVYNIELDKDIHRYSSVGEWVLKSYKGGWCYLVKGKENKIFHNGTTADVNSLYPSVMHSESGNRYPIGLPHMWVGTIPEEALINNRYYFVRIRTRFKLKDGYLPFIQIKGNYLYKGTECLETSDVYDKKTDKHYRFYKDIYGERHDTFVELTLTMTDYKLIQEHYHLIDCEILDGVWFESEIGIFDEYIDKYKEIKTHSKGAQRQEAKLFLNNLYGKMASSKDSSFKVAFLKDDNSIGFYEINESEKTPGYIPVGSAITSYARNFTIRAAQSNYHGLNNSGFIYADTDSIHCDLPANEVVGINVHPSDFCCWKLEASWDTAIFVRQKTYIEHVTHEDLEPISKPFYNVKCAGMPDRCKNYFIEGIHKKEYGLEAFKIGLKVPGKLMPKRIPGGIVLQDGYYEMLSN